MRTRTALLFATFIAVVGMGLHFANEWFAARRAQRSEIDAVEQARLRRTTAVVEVAPAPAPTALPLEGPDGGDALGRPLKWVDRAAFRSLLFHRKFVELTRYVEQLEAEVEKDGSRDVWLHDAVSAFSSSEHALDAPLAAWIAKTPSSFAPYLARAAHRVGVAFSKRGGKFASETDATDFEEMRRAFEGARFDLEQALVRHPNLVEARGLQIRVGGGGSDGAMLERALREALTTCPDCFVVRTLYMNFLTPRWGGSYDAMNAFAARAKAESKRPEMALLAGYADVDRADWAAVHEDDTSAALAAANRAVAVGESAHFLWARADVHLQRKEWAAALADYEHAATLRPGVGKARRATALWGVKRHEDAGRELLAVLRVDPTDAWARSLHPDIVKNLTLVGWQAHSDKKREDAVRIFDLAEALAPNDTNVVSRRAWAVLGTDAPDLATLEAAAAAHPGDFAVVQQTDYALAKAKQFARIVPLWTAYIAQNPDDGRAYDERSGTYWNLGRRREAIDDARRACELGVTPACAHLAKLGEAAR